MQAVAESPYPAYRSDYRASDRCPSSSVLSPSDEWIYPNYTVSPQAAPGRAQLSMYTTQRPPDQNYPSPSPSVPSPGPRMSASLEYSSQSSAPPTPPGADYSSVRDSQLGPVRHPRTRQLSLSYKGHGRRDSGELDPDDISRPQSPYDSYDPSRGILGAGLSLSIPSNTMDASHINSPYQPATPNSIPSPHHHHSDYLGSSTFDGRPPSPAPSNRSSPSAGAYPSQYSPTGYEGIPPSHGRAPTSRVKKHTKKKLDALEKKRICTYHKEHQNARQEDIAELFGIERSTVSKILKAKQHWLQFDDNAEVLSKNRPSKFPRLEDDMRTWLQDCADADITISDSAIRKRALESAASFGLGEDKFKASAGWIENFKHRFQIRGGKWAKAIPKSRGNEMPNPGLNGHTNTLGAPVQRIHPPPSTPSSRPFHNPPVLKPGPPQGGEDNRPEEYRGRPPKENWIMIGGPPTTQRSSSPTAIVQYHQLELPPPGDLENGSEEIPFAREDTERRGPTLDEAESAVETLINYCRDAPEGLVTGVQLTQLIHLRCALFQYATGVPYDTSVLDRHVETEVRNRPTLPFKEPLQRLC